MVSLGGASSNSRWTIDINWEQLGANYASQTKIQRFSYSKNGSDQHVWNKCQLHVSIVPRNTCVNHKRSRTTNLFIKKIWRSAWETCGGYNTQNSKLLFINRWISSCFSNPKTQIRTDPSYFSRANKNNFNWLHTIRLWIDSPPTGFISKW